MGTHEKLGGDRKTKTATGFRDRSLTTCLFYLELIKVITSPDGAVKEELINYDVPPLDNQSSDDMMDERLENARYTLSLIRMSGGDVFVLPEDLVRMEPKGVL